MPQLKATGAKLVSIQIGDYTTIKPDWKWIGATQDPLLPPTSALAVIHGSERSASMTRRLLE
jgi:hypothetical protein